MGNQAEARRLICLTGMRKGERVVEGSKRAETHTRTHSLLASPGITAMLPFPPHFGAPHLFMCRFLLNISPSDDFFMSAAIPGLSGRMQC